MINCDHIGRPNIYSTIAWTSSVARSCLIITNASDPDSGRVNHPNHILASLVIFVQHWPWHDSTQTCLHITNLPRCHKQRGFGSRDGVKVARPASQPRQCRMRGSACERHLLSAGRSRSPPTRALSTVLA